MTFPPATDRTGLMVFVLAVAFAWGMIGLNAWPRVQAIHRLTEAGRYALPAIDPGSPTGYRDGLRTVILPTRGLDGYHWIMAAQRLAGGDGWRIRYSPDDNAPEGRPLHWSQPLIWWLVALGWAGSFFNHLPTVASIERCAVWATVPIHALAVLLLPLALRRPLGWYASALLAAAMGCAYPFASLFFAGSPDHHGLVAFALLTCALFLSAALSAPHPSSSAVGASGSVWILSSGVAAGAALWINAATAAPALLLLQAGAAVGLLVWGWNPNSPAPTLWRRWGTATALSSLAFYLLEYFPGSMQLRLEVNSPLYALCFWAGGEALCQLARWRRGQSARLAGFLPAVLVLSGLAGVMVMMPETFNVRSQFLWNLHRDYIHEFLNYPDWLRKQHPEALVVALTPLFLLGPVGLWLLLRTDLDAGRKIGICSLGLAGAGFFVLGLFQVRWMNMAQTMGLALLAVMAAIFWQQGGRERCSRWSKWAAMAFCAVLLLQMPQRIVRDLWAQQRAAVTSPHPDEVAILSARETAYRLRALGGAKTPVVAAGPTVTTWMMYFGGMKGLGTLYWENLAGLQAAAALYAARSPEEAKEIIKRHGIDWIVFLWLEPFAAEYPRLLEGLPPGGTLPGTFAHGLVDGSDVPLWARAIMLPVPAEIPEAWGWAYDVRSARTP